MPNAAVHRPLNLATPTAEGEDVRALQSNINKQFKHLRIERSIRVDGTFGPQSFLAAKQVARCLGATGAAIKKLNRHCLSEGTQKLIRGRERTRVEAIVGKSRALYRKKLRERYAKEPGEKAVARALKYVGTTEKPPGSNWGGLVEKFIRFCGYVFAVFWCGCFAAWVVCKLGKAKIPTRIRLGFAPYITEDAKANRNGLTAVPSEDGRAGDICCLWGGKHIEVLMERPVNGQVRCIGGNTSKGGQESNGGEVAINTRSLADFDAGIVARPNY